ncbi:UNVERIFIED_CONTAM: protein DETOXIFICATION 21 [Sesamum latifolium]|uniref:Protein DETOXIFICATION 21 n=1 Tax=Sesamum latifolium TaxID=2727402 RepID=A0AAW2TMJ0_9LAMI
MKDEDGGEVGGYLGGRLSKMWKNRRGRSGQGIGGVGEASSGNGGGAAEQQRGRRKWVCWGSISCAWGRLGMANGLETLCGQAYGARQYHMLGIYLQRSWLVSVIASTVLLPIFIFTTPILKAIGQEDEIAEMAGTMALWLIPVIYSFIVSYTCQMYLQAQSKNMIIAYLAAIALSIHVFLSWLLTVQYKVGVSGAMISTVLAFWLPNIGQVVFIISGGCPETWRGFSTLAFKDLWPIFKLSLSAGAMLCVRIANELGSGNSKAAKFSITTIVVTSFGIGFVLFVFFLLFRERIAYLFTENNDVASSVGRLSPLLAFSILLNSVQPVLSGNTQHIG